MLRYFGTSLFLTIAALVIALVVLGPGAMVTTAVLIAIEIAFSFDNAIINAKVLVRLSPFWQRLFLTVGVLLAIVVVRFILPIVIVMITADLPWQTVVDDALHHPDTYSEYLESAHASIAAFGGSFLLVLSLYFLLDANRKTLWLSRIERPLQRLGGGVWLAPLVAAVVLVTMSYFAGEESTQVWQAGLFGVVAYTGIKLFIDTLERFSPKGNAMYVGWSAFGAFMYLQLLDASFSLDGVLGAFAITNQVLLIALGLGVGAIWVRSFTVFIARRGTLSSYRYLEHGAHYAIFVLSLALLASIFYEVPNAITGIVGLGVIGSSIWASRQARMADAKPS